MPSIKAVGLFRETPPYIRVIPVKVDVVSVDIPPLLGLDILDQHSLLADTVMNRLVKQRILQNSQNHKCFALYG